MKNDNKTALVEVNHKLIKKLKPHQVEGKIGMSNSEKHEGIYSVLEREV